MKKEAKKIIKNGKVAIAISPGFGAGWTTWNSGLSPFEPKVIEMILAGKRDEITKEWCEKELGVKNICCSGAKDLEIVWIKKGLRFSISEYDGNEDLYIENKLEYIA